MIESIIEYVKNWLFGEQIEVEKEQPKAKIHKDRIVAEAMKEPKKTGRGNKLSCKDIIWCRNHYKNGESIRSLSVKMNVSNSTLSRALSCTTYKHCCNAKK
jgi:hypothetical protein